MNKKITIVLLILTAIALIGMQEAFALNHVGGSISGFKIEDTNGNGIRDASEKGLQNWTITLTGIVGTGIDTKTIKEETTTDAQGFYRFDNLSAGRYILTETLKEGFVPIGSLFKNIELAENQNSMDNNFFNRPIQALIEGAKKPVNIEVFAPEDGDNAGLNNTAFIVDMEVEFHGFNLTQTGFTAPQLTGPGVHNNAPPFPGAFGVGKDEHFPGLIVLLSGTVSRPPFNGSGTNLANAFTITTVSNRQVHDGKPDTELWATWLIGAPNFGTGNSTLLVAVADDKNGDGIFNDAPNVVPDINNNGIVDKSDLEAFGVASNIVEVNFTINPNP